MHKVVRWKDYRIKSGDRQKIMRLITPEFIRRFLIYVLPDGFLRIRHYGLLASAICGVNITKIRALLCVERPDQAPASGPNAEITPLTLCQPCPCCGEPCASSRSSGAGKYQCRTRHHGSRPHDTPPA